MQDKYLSLAAHTQADVLTVGPQEKETELLSFFFDDLLSDVEFF